MFRYEKPQKGRYRQFHQIGVEVFNQPGPDIDAELIVLTARLWKQLGLADAVTLQLNSLGSSEARARYRDALVAYLQQRFEQLDEDSQRRLTTNPLRILDSKNAQTQALLTDAPTLHDYLDEESRAHFEGAQGPSGCSRHRLRDQSQTCPWTGLLRPHRLRVGYRQARRAGHGLCRWAL